MNSAPPNNPNNNGQGNNHHQHYQQSHNNQNNGYNHHQQHFHKRKNKNTNRNSVMESHGPDGKVRGNMAQIMERYSVLAKEAAREGDSIAAEGFFQHAEHYRRMGGAIPSQPSTESADAHKNYRQNKPQHHTSTDPATEVDTVITVTETVNSSHTEDKPQRKRTHTVRTRKSKTTEEETTGTEQV